MLLLMLLLMLLMLLLLMLLLMLLLLAVGPLSGTRNIKIPGSNRPTNSWS
jgi:hypothetical protein